MLDNTDKNIIYINTYDQELLATTMLSLLLFIFHSSAIVNLEEISDIQC